MLEQEGRETFKRGTKVDDNDVFGLRETCFPDSECVRGNTNSQVIGSQLGKYCPRTALA